MTELEYINAETNEILERMQIDKYINDAQVDIIEKFDKHKVFSMLIEFNSDILCEEANRFHDINNSMVKKMIIKVVC